MDLAALRAQQLELASEVVREDRLITDTPAFIGGADVGFEQGGEVTRAAMVLLKYPSLELVEYQVARIATTMPYIPGFLSFREYPALMAAWEKLSRKPDLLFVDGHGISHPRRLGVASHFGMLIDVPTIGVAKKRLCGKFEPLSDEPGAVAPLMDKGEQLAWVWRSKTAAIRCLSQPVIGWALILPWAGCSAARKATVCRSRRAGPTPSLRVVRLLYVGRKSRGDCGTLPLIFGS